jgi:hypothetical protein
MQESTESKGPVSRENDSGSAGVSGAVVSADPMGAVVINRQRVISAVRIASVEPARL